MLVKVVVLFLRVRHFTLTVLHFPQVYGQIVSQGYSDRNCRRGVGRGKRNLPYAIA